MDSDVSDESLQDTLPDMSPADLRVNLWHQRVLIQDYQVEVDSLKAANQQLQQQPPSHLQ